MKEHLTLGSVVHSPSGLPVQVPVLKYSFYNSYIYSLHIKTQYLKILQFTIPHIYIGLLYQPTVTYLRTFVSLYNGELFTFKKGKVRPTTDHKGPERKLRYSSTLSLTSALYAGGRLTPRPDRFTPGKETRYLLYRRLGGPQGRCGRVREISPQPGFDPWTDKRVASRYTD